MVPNSERLEGNQKTNTFNFLQSAKPNRSNYIKQSSQKTLNCLFSNKEVTVVLGGSNDNY